MSVPGVDFAWTHPSVGALKNAGEVFVVRYMSRDPSKDLTPAEAHSYLSNGIKVCANWEYTADAMRGGHAQGAKDAQNADTQCRACNVPGIPVYFSCDFDAAPGDQPSINAYLDACAQVLGPSRVGIYGGYWPVSRARAAGKVKYTWGTVAWSGTNWATAGWRPDIMQGPFINIGGVQCDLDAANSTDYGQWPRPSGPVKTWQTWQTKGHSSLQQIADTTGMSASHILRVTATHFHRFDDVVAAYVNGIHSGRLAVTDPVPAGGRFRVLH